MEWLQLGWDAHFDPPFEEYRERGLQAGRVSIQHRDLYHLMTADGEVEGIVTGRLRHEASRPADFPAVGDWVVFQPSDMDGPVAIQAVLPRRSTFSRQAAGTVPYEQVIATNIDTVFIVSGLDDNHSVRRIERYVTQGWESGAVPVLLLNKVDLYGDPEVILQETRAGLIGVDVHAISGERGDGIGALAPTWRLARPSPLSARRASASPPSSITSLGTKGWLPARCAPATHVAATRRRTESCSL